MSTPLWHGGGCPIGGSVRLGVAPCEACCATPPRRERSPRLPCLRRSNPGGSARSSPPGCPSPRASRRQGDSKLAQSGGQSWRPINHNTGSMFRAVPRPAVVFVFARAVKKCEPALKQAGFLTFRMSDPYAKGEDEQRIMLSLARRFSRLRGQQPVERP